MILPLLLTLLLLLLLTSSSVTAIEDANDTLSTVFAATAANASCPSDETACVLPIGLVITSKNIERPPSNKKSVIEGFN